jgi:small nuclear ribonucleoprotein D3
MSSGLGVPVKLLHESLGHIITVELKTGQLYRGKLAEGQYNQAYCNFKFNVQS